MTVVIYRSKHERFYGPKKELSLPLEEKQQIIRLDPESKRNHGSKYERVSEEKLIL
jgi:hypothetical protein